MKKLLAIISLFACIAAGAQDLEGKFTQTKTIQVSGKTIKSEGSITYTAPDQLAMLYTNPAGDFFIIDGPFIRMDMRGVQAEVNSDNNASIKAQRNAILYSISGRYEEIAKEMDADCKVTNTKTGGKHVEIKVRKTMPKGYSGLILDYKKGGQISKMVLEEFGGISTEYVLTL